MGTIVGVEDVVTAGFINHVVTLLQNGRKLKNVSGIDCGNEFFVDSRHAPITLPFQLQNVSDSLFGSDPDRCFFTVRMWTLLQALTNTGLADQYLSVWPRVTYDLNGTSLFNAAYGINRTSAYPNPGLSTPQITVIGEIEANNGLGRLLHSWIIKVSEVAGFWGGYYPGFWGGSRLIEVTNVIDNSKQTYETASEAVPLYSEGSVDELLTAYFESEGWNISYGYYTVDGLGRPNEDLSDIYQRIFDLGQATLDFLFTGSGAIALGKSLFYNHKVVAYKVAGAVLALVYKIDALR